MPASSCSSPSACRCWWPRWWSRTPRARPRLPLRRRAQHYLHRQRGRSGSMSTTCALRSRSERGIKPVHGLTSRIRFRSRCVLRRRGRRRAARARARHRRSSFTEVRRVLRPERCPLPARSRTPPPPEQAAVPRRAATGGRSDPPPPVFAPGARCAPGRVRTSGDLLRRRSLSRAPPAASLTRHGFRRAARRMSAAGS